MRRAKQRNLCGATVAGLLLLFVPFGVARPKKIKASDNPPQYASFSKPLSKGDQLHHALDRLTFGPRPGDFEALQKIGLDKWINLQLHPEKIPENPILAERLAPFTSVRMSIHDTWVHYPAPRVIRAVARGQGRLPDDPELRAIIVQLANRYLKKANAKGQAEAEAQAGAVSANISDEDADLEYKEKLSDVLTPEQIDTLRFGKPEEKRELLASIPQDKMMDVAWALRPQQKRRLVNLAPVELRRTMMLTINPQNVVASDLAEAKLFRAIYSNHQLEELLVDFWYNHFNVFINKGGERYLAPTYEREAIRPHVFGKFYDLLLATAKSPAMLFFLDDAESVGANSIAAQRARTNKRRGLNENYGRELMELHTLGVNGGYTQKDVIEVARCFTGWTIAPPAKGGAFFYNDRMHDKGKKVVLGHVIRAGGGMDDGLKVLQILAHEPATAHHISFELAQRFVADDPPPSLVNRMANTFTKTDGDLREVVRTMISSPEFWSKGAYHAKMKSPFEMVVSAVRAANADVSSAYLLDAEIQRLGEPLYRKIEPTGYSNANSEWVSSAGLLDRMNFALALAHNRVPGVEVDVGAWQALAKNDPMDVSRDILAQNPSAQTAAAIEKTLKSEDLQKQLAMNAKTGPPQMPSLVAGLTIGSPEFQRR